MDYGMEQYQNDLERYVNDIQGQLNHLSHSWREFNCCIMTEFETLQKLVNEAHNITSTYYLQHYLSPYTEHFATLSLAAQHLSNKRHGGLIVIERDINVDPYIHSGTPIGAKVSHTLLETIFYPGNPIHDGGTLIRKDEIVSAGNILPVTEKQIAGKILGTRHRAAIGMTEQTDAVAIVVSEETGRISFAFEGELYVVRP
ncbi:sporulation-specific diadenylate cyclase CdaS [Cytobacillus purgationiresistens]|uniref:Diadenylate cyclase n=1 Tax=Cytobacillus purgationiresistens TaxID=863449 RepID=A0ABU0AGI5_9BACI|nr:sporulation-specific diadenylate cyclase CdaS [Cytobacillus purgationiresistens]MDQ0270359.1 uncharacterized protein (TIGR00159 family) [Cytobacillus purgationiresistens]